MAGRSGLRFRPLVVATLAVAHDGTAEGGLRRALEETRQRAAAIPGVEATTLTDFLPLSGPRSSPITVPGRDEPIEVFHQVVGPRYFETLRQPLLRGRGWEDHGMGEGALPIVVNQELAHELWPASDPLGQALPLDLPRLSVHAEGRVVGVAADALHDLKHPARPQVYLPASHVPRLRMSLLLRTAVPPESAIETIRETLSRAHPRLAVVNVAPFERQIETSLFEERLYARMGGITAALGLVLAATGIYSVLAYVVRARRRETAIRMAIGATPRDVLARAMREVARPVLLGALIGLAGAIAGARLLRAMLFAVDPLDPATLAAAPALVLVCAALAALGPSLRAGRTDPMTVLREEGERRRRGPRSPLNVPLGLEREATRRAQLRPAVHRRAGARGRPRSWSSPTRL